MGYLKTGISYKKVKLGNETVSSGIVLAYSTRLIVLQKPPQERIAIEVHTTVDYVVRIIVQDKISRTRSHDVG